MGAGAGVELRIGMGTERSARAGRGEGREGRREREREGGAFLGCALPCRRFHYSTACSVFRCWPGSFLSKPQPFLLLCAAFLEASNACTNSTRKCHLHRCMHHQCTHRHRHHPTLREKGKWDQTLDLIAQKMGLQKRCRQIQEHVRFPPDDGPIFAESLQAFCPSISVFVCVSFVTYFLCHEIWNLIPCFFTPIPRGLARFLRLSFHKLLDSVIFLKRKRGRPW